MTDQPTQTLEGCGEVWVVPRSTKRVCYVYGDGGKGHAVFADVIVARIAELQGLVSESAEASCDCLYPGEPDAQLANCEALCLPCRARQALGRQA